MSDSTGADKLAAVMNRKWLAGIMLPTVLILSLAVWWMLRSRITAFGFKERDWIVVCDFENRTGEEILDNSLDAALRVGISQSSYVNVVPRSRIDQILYWMKKATDTRVDEPMGRQIAKTQGIRILLVPRIAGVEGGYEISLILENPSTGATLKSETARATKKEDVLGSLDQMIRQVRQILGEPDMAISRESKPLAKVLTPSLEALKQYALGIEKSRQGIVRQARVSYENALAIDPNFTAAKASLGRIHFEADQARTQWGVIPFEGIDLELGKRLLAEAVAQAEQLTDRERYGIQAYYARTVENDRAKAAQHLTTLIGLYPDDSAAHNNLGLYYKQMGRSDEAAAEYKEVLRLDPNLMQSYDSLIGIYLYELGRVSEAIALCQDQIARNDRYAQVYDNLGWAYLGKDDLVKARDAFQKAIKLSPRFTGALFRLAHTYRLQKKYRDALEPLQQIPETEDATVLYQRGVLLLLLNEKKMADKHFELYRSYLERDLNANPKDENAQMQLAIVQARLGQNDKALAAREKALSLDGSDHFGAALVSGVMGKTDEALDRLELAVQKGFSNYIWMKIHPDLQGLYGQTRFVDLLRRTLK
jgi:tetratricopeptide (TPR) repeat protein